MIEQLLAKEEGKTLEFKENSNPIQRIVQTAIAFANTAGGTILVGVKDATKEVIGLDKILEDELRITNAIADSVIPLLVPTIQFCSWRNRDVLIITIHHSLGPYYLKSKGETEGAYIRLGSTNRPADARTLSEIHRLKEHVTFDQLPDFTLDPEDLDFNLASQLFKNDNKSFTKGTAKSLELLVSYQSRLHPSKGGLLLFGRDREALFPDPIVRMVRFEGTSKNKVLDQLDTRSPLPIAFEEIYNFIRRNTSLGSLINDVRRIDIPQYQPVVLREAILNALVHADYSIRAPLNIAIYDDRLEITNPGPLPFGLSLETALSGVSQLRNRVLGRIFRELKFTDQWGSGLNRMIEACRSNNSEAPKFEELGQFFKVTLFPRSLSIIPSIHWQTPIIEHIQKEGKISAKIAQEIWKISRRATTTRLKEMCNQGLLVEMATGPRDPHKVFILAKG